MSATIVSVRGCRTIYHRLSYLSQQPTLLTKFDARVITKMTTPQRQFLTQLFRPSSYRHLQQIGKGAQLHTSRLQPAAGMIRTMLTRLKDQLSGRVNSKGSGKGGDGQWSAIDKAARQKKHLPNVKFQDRFGKGPGGPGQQGSRSSPPFSPGDLITGLGVLMLIDFLVASNTNSKSGQKDVSMQFFLQNMLAVGEVDRIEVDKDNECAFISLHKDAVIEGIEFAPSKNIYRVSLGSIATFERQLEEFQQELGLNETDFVGVRYINDGGSNFLSELFFALIPVAIFVGIFALSARRSGSSGGSTKSGSGGMGDMFQVGKIKADARALPSATRFKDVAGLTEAKVEVMEFVEYLKNPAQFETLGAKVPKGALLTGPPGTGKTLLAKAVAGEAQVPFFAVSGSDFVEMFVGVGASRVRDLFKKARESKPAIIYIDEIDAVGKARSSGGEGGNQERETTLNQLLVEMDGFNTESGIIILASTNRADTLDKALLRPGRFDRQIECDLPTLPERKQIFEVHLKPITMDTEGKDKLINQLSALTPGMSGAQIANVCNEAALHAARRGAALVEQIDFASAADRVMAGSEKKSRAMSHKQLEVVAYHESGHVLTAWLIDSAAPLLKTTIIPRTSGALGFAQYMPSEKLLFSTQELENQLVVLLGGRAAEMHKFGSITTGAQDDLQRVTQMAYAMLTQYGMSSSIGNLSFPDFPKPEQGKRSTSNALAESVEREVDKVVRRAYLRAETILRENNDQLTKLAEELLKRETLTYDDVEAIIGERPFPHVHPYKIVDVPPLAGEDDEESNAHTNAHTDTDTDTPTTPPTPGEPTPAI
eukprot:m.12686 g.12686  ORF g.12686 m.12686 type:complete len:824 (+) comp9410_c0_seq1:301-2772(+)